MILTVARRKTQRLLGLTLGALVNNVSVLATRLPYVHSAEWLSLPLVPEGIGHGPITKVEPTEHIGRLPFPPVIVCVSEL